MTGDDLPVPLPEGWHSIPIRAIARRREEANRPELPLLSVYRDIGVLPREGREDNYNKPGLDLSTYKVVHPGDLVLNKMKTWQGSLAVSDHHGIVSPAYFVCQLANRIHPRFLHYQLRSRPYIATYAARSKGIRPQQWDLPWDAFKSIRLVVPPEGEQRAIADFLDRETARIDRLLASRMRLLALLDGREVALAFAAIAGSNLRDKRRTSDLAWLRDIPELWSVAPVSRHFEVQLGRMLNPERATGPNLKPYVRNANVRWDTVNVSDLALMDFPPSERARYRLQTGDLLINEGGAGMGRSAIWMGEIGECYFQKSVLRLRPRGTSLAQWMLECMRAAVAMRLFNVEGNVATIPHLPAESLKAHRFPFPPSDVQANQLRWLAVQKRSHVPIRKRVERQGKLLREHRQALITAAVTGRLDVTKVA